MHLKSVVSPHHFAGYLLSAAIVFLQLTSLVFASPADVIARAVYTGGATEITEARPEQILISYTAVLARLKLHQLPDYVTAAVRLRPDLAAEITSSSIRAAMRNARNRQILDAVVERIVRAAILPQPDAAVVVARAAVETAPALRDRIVAAAIAAAPRFRLAILHAISGRGSLASAFPAVGFQRDFSAAFGNMNPSESSDLEENVNSPEQPPTGP